MHKACYETPNDQQETKQERTQNKPKLPKINENLPKSDLKWLGTDTSPKVDTKQCKGDQKTTTQNQTFQKDI